MYRRPPTSQNIFVFGLGLVAGWFVKQLFDSPEFQSKRQKIMATATEIRQRLVDIDEDGRVKAIFGKSTREFAQIYQDVRNQLIDELDTLKLAIDEIDKDKYSGIVSEVITSLKDTRLSKEQVEKLSKFLLDDFKKLTNRRQEFKKALDLSSNSDKKEKATASSN